MPNLNLKMRTLKLFAELMTNKYFLIFLTGLSAINIVGYLSMGCTDAVILFALISFITFIFSKNMSVVLLTSVVIVNLFMHCNLLEGVTVGGKRDTSQINGGYAPLDVGNVETLINKEDVDPADDAVEEEPAEVETVTITEQTVDEDEDEDADGEKEGFIDFIRDMITGNKKEGLKDNKDIKGVNKGMNKVLNKGMNKISNKKEGMNKKTKETTEEAFQQLKPAVVKQHPHIDYGTTLTDAYKNLEKMLGEGGLKNLTDDTKQLMEQQSKLFNSMENIAPLLSQAQDLMKKMDMGKMSGKVGGIADSAEPLGKSNS